MLHRLLHYIVGGLRLELSGPRVANFINLALQEEIPLWDLQAEEALVRLTLPPQRFWELRPIARKTRTRVRQIGRSGLPFRLARLRRRYVFWGGIAAVLLTVWWASAHIWVIQVEGTSRIDARAVVAAARELGLKPGVWRRSVNPLALQADLPVKVGGLTWAAVHTQGVRAVIQVVEMRAPADLPEEGRIDIVATKPGKIVQIVPLYGQAHVKVGDTVQEGQQLISGQILYYDTGRPMVMPGVEKPPRTAVGREMPAQGFVRARVSYDFTIEIPGVTRRVEETGEGNSIWRLRWGGREILVGRAPALPAGFQDRVSRTGNWRIPGLPVELQRERHDLVKVHVTPLPKEQLEKTARDKVMTRLSWSLPARSTVESVATTIVPSGDLAQVQVHVVTIENIGRPTPAAGEAVELPAPEEAPAPDTVPPR